MDLYTTSKDDYLFLVRNTSNYFGLDYAVVEKDYFATLFLKKANASIPGLVFKGGTSLSKCFHIINRFSEDIDLALDLEHSSQSSKRETNRTLIKLCSSPPFNLVNKELIIGHTHGTYNCFEVGYPSLFGNASYLAPQILVEMVNFLKCYPCIEIGACSYIGEYLISINKIDILEKYDLKPFLIKVQALERTFVDKVFAICDYYEHREEYRNSRHIYDLFMIEKEIDLLSDKIKQLIKSVRNDRKKSKRCISAADGYDINVTLQTIVNTNYYRKDYNDVTRLLLTKDLPYEIAITVINKIVKLNLF